MVVAEDGDEVVEALYEFVSNCRMFAEADEEETEQINKEEFEAVLDECESKCEVLSCIEAEGALNIAEFPMISGCVELCVKEKNDVINVFLPRVNIQEDKEKYIPNLIGTTLYRVISKKFDADYIKHEINRYIPTSRIVERSAKEMFVDYFYDVNLDDDDMGQPKFVEGFVPAGKLESGKSVNYTLAIANSSFITFEQPTIDPWGAPQTGGTIIIK